MTDQTPIPSDDELAQTIDVLKTELILVSDDETDLNDTQLLDQPSSPTEKLREEVIWVSEQPEKTFIVPAADASDPEVARYLRDMKILELQRKGIAIELDPATDRDTSGRPKFKKGDFGLSGDQQKKLLGVLGQILKTKDVPAYALALMIGDPAFCLNVQKFLVEQMDTFRCTSMPYVIPDYSLRAIRLLRQTGCAVNMDPKDFDIVRNLPRACTKPKEGARILFFQMARNASPLEVEERYRQLNLRPLDFWELCAFNLKYPSFLVSQPNATHWVVEGDWRFAAFYTHDRDVIRRVAMKRPADEDGFIRGWHFAGVPLEA